MRLYITISAVIQLVLLGPNYEIHLFLKLLKSIGNLVSYINLFLRDEKAITCSIEDTT